MIDLTLSILALVAGGVSLELFAGTAPSSTAVQSAGLTDAFIREDFVAGNPS